MKDAVRRAFSQEKPDSGTKVLEREIGWEEMQDARKMDEVNGD